jgi:cell division inhibitor SepF
MAGGGIWHRTLVYFGLADEDDDYEDETFTAQPDVESTYRERANVRKIERTSRRRQSSDFDDIFAEESRSQRASVRPLPTRSSSRRCGASGDAEEIQRCSALADKFKSDIPVIINLQASETDLANGSSISPAASPMLSTRGMQSGGGQGVPADSKNVEVSAEERQRLIEKGFYNQS